MEKSLSEESNQTKKKGKLIKKLIVLIVAGLIAACIGSFFIYVSDYYHASDEVQEYLTSTDEVTVEKEEKWISFKPADGEYTKGFIFYPGAKVEYTAYAQLMNEIASEGYQCILVKMPFNLAVFGINSAGKVRKAYPKIESWYVGGHSLGGAMAASYVSSHSEDYDGLILLGAYSNKDLTDTALSVLSIYGENDQVLNMDKLVESDKKMPYDFNEYCIDGGNHAYYGNYGEQKGDGTALIEREDQIMETALQITMFMD